MVRVLTLAVGVLLALSLRGQADTCHQTLDYFAPYSEWSGCGVPVLPSDTPYAAPMGLVDALVMYQWSSSQNTYVYRHVRIRRYTDGGCPVIYRPEGERCYP